MISFFKRAILTAAAALALSAISTKSAWAQTIQIRNVNCQGDGCRGAQVVSAPDATTVSVLYSGFRVALADRPGRMARDNLSSQLLFSVLVPEGYRLEFVNMDLRGFANLSGRAAGRLEIRQNGKKRKGAPLPDLAPIKIFNEASNGEFLQTVALGAPFKSDCGDEVNFRVISRLILAAKLNPGPRANREADASEISLDSTDLSAPSLVYQTQLKRCQ